MASVQIDRLDGSRPVQATGTIGGHSAFYFRGRHEVWQFVAGPKELSTDDLVGVKLGMATDDRVFVLEGDDDDRDYQDYDHVRKVLQDYAQQYVEWVNERKIQQTYQEAIEFARDFKSKYPYEEMKEDSRKLSGAINELFEKKKGRY